MPNRSEDIEDVAERVALRVLERLGIDASDPIAIQRDFQHLRSWRVASETAKAASLKAAIGALTTGFLGAAYMLFKSGGGPHS